MRQNVSFIGLPKLVPNIKMTFLIVFSFRSGRLLLAHIRQVHELAQEYVCEVCARQFKNKQTFHNHVKYEHSETPPSKVQCDICGAW